ncbi:hypothetical protein DAI22_04g086800 [Oryza sativa Japonica Group]|nr:hypothetical protein DAI22_04g086800 [Oryza sativa Japonica Group]
MAPKENIPSIFGTGSSGKKVADETIPPPHKSLHICFSRESCLPGFEEIHISVYYAHLVTNPHIARAFDRLPFENKIHWVAMFINVKFPGSM